MNISSARRILHRLALAGWLIPLAGTAYPQIAAWQFSSPASSGNEATYAATTLDPNMAPSTLSRGTGISPTSLGRGFSANTWNSTSQAAAIANDEYFQFTLEATTGYQVSLSTIDAKMRRSSSGPNAYIWQYSVDGTTFNDIGAVVPFTTAATDGTVQSTINLSGIAALQAVESGTSIILRLYAWGASAESGTFAFGRYDSGITTNSLAIGGTVEPATGTPGVTSVSFDGSAASVSEGSGTANLTLNITNPSGTNATSVDVVLASGDAARIGNYTTQTVTWAAGDGDPKTVALAITDNAACDGDASLSFTLQNITGGDEAEAGANDAFALTVEDNETAADPTATAASAIGENGFTANWDAVAGATGYFLDVSTSPTFGTTTPATDLFFSEYVEGSSNNKYIEIYNGTGAPVDLSLYTLELYANGATAANNSVALSGTLADQATIVFKNSNATIYPGGTSSAVCNFNGDDAIALVRTGSGAFVDIIGRIGEDPGSSWVSGGTSTVDHTLVRKSTVSGGVTSNPASGFPTLATEWDSYAVDDASHLGGHNYGGFSPSFVPGHENLPVAGTSQAVTGLDPNTTYYYRVRANSGCGASLNSNVESATTLSAGCTDPLADNYDPASTSDDGSCTYCAPTITYNSPSPTAITIGSGIPDQNMAVAQDCRGIDVALSAFARYVGPIVPAGNTYTTTTGHSPVSGSDPTPDPALARWNILGSVDLGSHDFTEVTVLLDADFDPGATPVWESVNLSQLMIANGLGSTSLYQASENPASAFWTALFPGAASFDPDAPGTYGVRVRLQSTYSGEDLGSLAIEVVVEQTCAAHTGNVWYVNDASLSGDVYTTAAGSDGNTGTMACPFGTIAHAIAQASAGDTILVDAGTYVENLVVDKAIDLRGAQYNADPNTRTGAESVIHPAISDPDPLSAGASVVIYLDDHAASGTRINGFTIDGDNPAITSGTVFNGADMDAIEAIGSYLGNGDIDIAYNTIKNLTYAGLDLDNYTGTGIVNGITVHHNLFHNISSASWGQGVVLQYNAYADITDNTMSQVRVGIQTGNHSQPNTGGDPVISGNTISSYRLGIFHNVQYAAASPFHITGNHLLTESGSSTNTGILIGTIDPTVTMALQGNDVTGAQRGIMLWNSNSPAGITVEGGTLTDCGIGVFVNNYDGYPASPDATRPIHAILNNVTITNADTGVYVKDNVLNTHATATLHVDIAGTTTINVADGGVNVRVSGAKSSLAFVGNGVDLTGNALRHIRLESNGSTMPATAIDATQVKFNGAAATSATGFAIEDLIDHKVDLLGLGEVTFVPGEVFVTVNSFVAPNTAGSVQRGIDVSANGETVHVNDGTYNEDVNVNKAITLVGNDRDLTILRGLYGTTANALSVGANATVTNLTSTRDFGATLAEWQASPKVNGLTFTGNNATVDNVRVTGHRNGVYINNRQNVQVLNSIIEANRTGIQLGNNASGTQILNNFIQDNFTMGLLFNFDLGGTPNTTGLVVSENSFGGNWYAEVSYQGTPTSAVGGADFSCNWYGTSAPAASATATAEPGYASQVPAQFGGTAPGAQVAQIMGVSAALVPFEPYGLAGTDDQPGTPGWQPVPNNCELVYYSQASGDVSDPIWDIVPAGTPGPATFSPAASMVVQNGHAVANTAATDVKNLTVEPGGSLALSAGSALNVNGDEASFDGTLTAAANSTLALVGADGVVLQAAAPLNLHNLTVNTPNGVLTDATIAVRGTLQLDDGEFDASAAHVTLSSTATGTGRLGPVASGASYTGNITVQRYIPAGHTNWRMLASPVAGNTVANWQDDFFTAGYPGSAYPNFQSPVGSGILWPSVRWYNEANPFALADSGVVGVASSTQPLAPGQGFLAWSGDNLTTTQAFTVDVTGAPTIAQAPITLPMSFTATGTPEADGWNLVGNPLPSPINFTHVFRGGDVENAYYIFNPVTGNNSAWTNGVGQGGLNGVIQSSQGFWLKADGPNITTTVDEGAKVNAAGGGTFGGDQDAALPILNLTLASGLNTYSDEATLVFAQGTPAHDPTDALKMTFKTIGAPQIGIMSSDGQQLAVDFFGSYATAVQIPLKVDVDVSGTYTITAALAGINNLSCLSLTDLQTGAVTPLTDGASYSFAINADDDANTTRFVINGSAPLPLNAEAALCHDQPGTATVVLGEGPVDVTWTDVFGNVLLQQGGLGNTTAAFSAPAGAYQVHVSPGGACGELAADFSITAPDAIAAEVTQTATTCPASADGGLAVVPTGGTAPYTFLWSNGATTASFTGNAGNYAGIITDAAGCASDSIHATIPAGEGTIAQFAVAGGILLVNTPVQFSNGSVLADSYLWDFGDGATSTESDPAHTYAIAGSYTVTLTASGGECTDSFTLSITVEMSTGIAPVEAAGLSVRATADHLLIDHPFGNAPVDVDVYDATGRLALGRSAIVQPGRITLGDRALNPGVWFVRVTSGGVQHTFRVPLLR